MKRIAITLCIVFLGVIAFTNFKNYRRFSPPTLYIYTLRTDIDAQYHDPSVLLAYYENARRLPIMAREQWYNNDIDVLTPDHEKQASVEACEIFRKLQATTDVLGARLAYSAQLKKLGFTNAEIREIELKGLSVFQAFTIKKALKLPLQRGDQNGSVWELQHLLVGLGYQMPVDGNFVQETESAVKAFQQKNKLYPSGVADEATMILLLQNKKN